MVRLEPEGDHPGVRHASKDPVTHPAQPSCRWRQLGERLGLYHIQHNCLAATCLNSCIIESWEITNQDCFMLLNLKLICYTAIDNWYNMICLRPSRYFSGSLSHIEDNLQINKAKCNSSTWLPEGRLEVWFLRTYNLFMYNFNVFVHLISELRTVQNYANWNRLSGFQT